MTARQPVVRKGTPRSQPSSSGARPVRIAFASDNGRTVACHTGRYSWLIIFDIAGHDVRRIEARPVATLWPPTATPAETAISPLSYNVLTPDVTANALADCQALVTGCFGSRLALDLRASGLDVYLCNSMDPEEAARDFAAGRVVRAHTYPHLLRTGART